MIKNICCTFYILLKIYWIYKQTYIYLFFKRIIHLACWLFIIWKQNYQREILKKIFWVPIKFYKIPWFFQIQDIPENSSFPGFFQAVNTQFNVIFRKILSRSKLYYWKNLLDYSIFSMIYNSQNKLSIYLHENLINFNLLIKQRIIIISFRINRFF